MGKLSSVLFIPCVLYQYKLLIAYETAAEEKEKMTLPLLQQSIHEAIK
jgi:hypothetical protein